MTYCCVVWLIYSTDVVLQTGGMAGGVVIARMNADFYTVEVNTAY